MRSLPTFWVVDATAGKFAGGMREQADFLRVLLSLQAAIQMPFIFLNGLGGKGTEFFTGSSDGFVKWWDIRNFKEPVKQYMLQTSTSKNTEFPPGINCLSFEPTM